MRFDNGGQSITTFDASPSLSCGLSVSKVCSVSKPAYNSDSRKVLMSRNSRPQRSHYSFFDDLEKVDL